MKVHVNIERLVLHDHALSQRERRELRDAVARELDHILDPQRTATSDGRRRPGASVATQIAMAVAAQVTPHVPHHRAGAPR